MFTQRTQLDEAPAHVPLEQARNMGYVACAAALVSAVVFPAPIFQIPVAIAGYLASRRVQGRLDELIEEHARLSRTRLFNYDESRIPVKVDAQGEVIPPDDGPSRWEAPMVPYKMAYRTETIVDAEASRHVHAQFREIVGRHHSNLVKQAEFLAQHHPQRRALVDVWWRQTYILPALRRRHPTHVIDLLPGSNPLDVPEFRVWPVARRSDMPAMVADREIPPVAWMAEVGRDYQVEFFEGVRIALQPTTWKDRPDERPSFVPYTTLRRLLDELRQRQYDEGAAAAATTWVAQHGTAKPVPLYELPPDPAVPDDIRIWFPVAGWICLGKGFTWDLRHAQRYYDLLAHDLSEVSEVSADEGDPRVYGVGLNDERVMFVKEKLFRQHYGVMGASGVGKTRALELIVDQAIRNNRPLFLLDPKGDAEMLNRVVEQARLYGRGHKVHVLNFFDPLNPEGSTYNPLYRFSHVSDLGSRVGACVENSKDPFWKNAAIATARVVCDLCHYVAEYLQLIGVATEQGKIAHFARSDRRIPELFLALQGVQVDGIGRDVMPAMARPFITHFHQSRKNPAFAATTVVDKAMLDMYRQTLYTPVAWAPNFKTISRFGIGNPEVLLAWALKVTHFHVYGFSGGNPAHKDPNQPQLATIADVVGTGGQSQDYMWAQYKRAGDHPLERRLPGAMKPSGQFEELIQAYFDEFVPAQATPVKQIERVMKGLRDALENMRVIASEDRKRFQETMSTLRASLSRLEGDRERIVNSPDPDMNLVRGIENDEIYYIYLSTLKDPVGSSAVAKAFCEDLISMVAEIQGRFGSRPDKIKPFYFFGDELGSWATDSVTLMLQQARSAGLQAVLVGQAPKSDLEAQLGSHAKAKQVLANLSTFASLRLNLVEDQKDFADQVGHVPIIKKSRNIGGTPGYGDIGLGTIKGYSANEGYSYSEEQKPLLPYAALGALPIGHVMMRTMGRQYCYVVGRLPSPTTNVLKEHGIEVSERERAIEERAQSDDRAWEQAISIVDRLAPPTDTPLAALRPEAPDERRPNSTADSTGDVEGNDFDQRVGTKGETTVRKDDDCFDDFNFDAANAAHRTRSGTG